jgi:hypothetical protein
MVFMIASCTPYGEGIITPEASATRTGTATITITPTRTNTPTLIPTLPLEEAMARIAELEETNGGCEYPCYWGITPGVTTWEDARLILAPIAEYIELEGVRNHRYMYWINTTDGVIEPEGYRHGFEIFVFEHVVEKIVFYKALPLDGILRFFGPPSEVLYAVAEGSNDYTSFEFYLLYPEQGMIIEVFDYDHSQYVVHDDGVRYVEICSPGIGLHGASVTLYDPTDPHLYERVLDEAILGSHDLPDIYSGLGISVEEFYATFSDPSSQACLSNPAQYIPEWLSP